MESTLELINCFTVSLHVRRAPCQLDVENCIFWYVQYWWCFCTKLPFVCCTSNILIVTYFMYCKWWESELGNDAGKPHDQNTFVIFQIIQRMCGITTNKPHLCWKSTKLLCCYTLFFKKTCIQTPQQIMKVTMDVIQTETFPYRTTKLKNEIVGPSAWAKSFCHL